MEYVLKRVDGNESAQAPHRQYSLEVIDKMFRSPTRQASWAVELELAF